MHMWYFQSDSMSACHCIARCTNHKSILGWAPKVYILEVQLINISTVTIFDVIVELY